MKTGLRWSEAAVIFFSTLSLIFVFSIATVGAVQMDATPGRGPDSTMIQYKAGDHILGFAPHRAYLASLDHALIVQFLGTKGVMPTSDTPAPVTGTATKAVPLGKVMYQNLWDGISLTYVATEDGITESTYHVAPGADVSRIRLRYNVPVEMRNDGSLQFKFNSGTLTESAPIAWQETGGKRKPVDVAFRIDEGAIGFQVGAYDRSHPLIIDPTYQWHTFYGSSGYHIAQGIVTDGSGNVYVTGYSANSWNGPEDQPPLNPFIVGGGNVNIFVLKLNSSGAYQWHTFYGLGNDYIHGIALQGSADLYVTGYTDTSWNGPAPANTAPLHAFNSVANSNLFILKLNDTAGAVVPSVTTAAVTSITQTSATSGGNVTADGGATVTTRGVCWSTSANPIRTGNHTTDGSGIGPFTSAISGLSPYTTYHVRAYATNSAGTGYGDDLYFTTPCPDYVAYIGITGHGTLQGAIDSVVGAAEIRAVAGERQGALTISGNKSITLLGGYDCVCGAVIGVTSVRGSVTIGAGASMTASNLAVY